MSSYYAFSKPVLRSATEGGRVGFGDVLPAFLTTIPWQAILAKKIFDETGETKMKSFLQLPGMIRWNTNIIDKLNKLSKDKILPGADRYLYMSANANVSREAAASFVKNLPNYFGKDVKAGPGAFLEAFFTSAGKVIEGAGDTGKAVPVVVIVLALGVAGYLIFAGRKGTKLTPF